MVATVEAPRETRYVVLHTMVGSGNGTALQSDVVLPRDMGIEGAPAEVQAAIDRLVGLGAIRPLWEHEYDLAERNMEGDIRRLPGVRYEGAVQPQQGIREGLTAQAAKQRALMDQHQRRLTEEAAREEEQRSSRGLLLMLARRQAAKELIEAQQRRLVPASEWRDPKTGENLREKAERLSREIAEHEAAMAASMSPAADPVPLPEPGEPEWHELEKQTAPEQVGEPIKDDSPAVSEADWTPQMPPAEPKLPESPPKRGKKGG